MPPECLLATQRETSALSCFQEGKQLSDPPVFLKEDWNISVCFSLLDHKLFNQVRRAFDDDDDDDTFLRKKCSDIMTSCVQSSGLFSNTRH